MATDLRDTIFACLDGRRFTAEVRLTSPGLVCGATLAATKVRELGCEVLHAAQDGDMLKDGEPLLRLRGSAKAVAMAEDVVPGAVSVASGIARAARHALDLADGRVRIVTGSAKKHPCEIKTQVRAALACGGVSLRMAEGPFLYLDKNYVRMFGGVRSTLEAVAHMQGMTRAVQVRGEMQDLAQEVADALELGVEVLMVDTGRADDLDLVSRLVREAGRREAVTIAFAGDIAMEDIDALAGRDVDVLGVGRAIIDAPMVDVKFDVVPDADK